MNQERLHLHLLGGVEGNQPDLALRVNLAALVDLVQHLAGCRQTWLASVQANMARVSAAKPGFSAAK